MNSVNVRHLGGVRKFLPNGVTRDKVLAEMIARVLKDMIKYDWREESHQVEDIALLYMNYIGNRDKFSEMTH